MREKYLKQKTISFTINMYEKIGKAAADFDVSFAEIVRECITRELDKLVDREKRRKRSRQKS